MNAFVSSLQGFVHLSSLQLTVTHILFQTETAHTKYVALPGVG